VLDEDVCAQTGALRPGARCARPPHRRRKPLGYRRTKSVSHWTAADLPLEEARNGILSLLLYAVEGRSRHIAYGQEDSLTRRL